MVTYYQIWFFHMHIFVSTIPDPSISLQYPEHHMIGFHPIDEKFRDIGTSLRKAVDLKEEYLCSLLHFREACGYECLMGLVECIGKMCVRAKESAVQLKFEAKGEVRR